MKNKKKIVCRPQVVLNIWMWSVCVQIGWQFVRVVCVVIFTASFRGVPCHSFDCHSHVIAFVDSSQQRLRPYFQHRWLDRMYRSSYYNRSMGCHSSSCDSCPPAVSSDRLVCDWNSLVRWVQYLVRLKRTVYNFRHLRSTHRLSNSDCS